MKEKKNLIWQADIDTILEVYELAKQRGKKPGDDISKEFLEIMKKKNIKPIGTTDKDIDLLAGDLREEGKKVLNLKEIERRNKEEKNE